MNFPLLEKSAIILLALGAITLSAWHLIEYAMRWSSDFIVDHMVSHWDKHMAAVRGQGNILLTAAYVAAYARLQNLYPYTRFIPRGADPSSAVTVNHALG